MNLKKCLSRLSWNTFVTYPPQETNIYVKISEMGNRHANFIKIQKFNAVSFEPRDLLSKLERSGFWEFYWLTEEFVNCFIKK